MFYALFPFVIGRKRKHSNIDGDKQDPFQDFFFCSTLMPLCPEPSSQHAIGYRFQPFLLVEVPDESHLGGSE